MNEAELTYASHSSLRVHINAGKLLKLLEVSSNFSNRLQRGVLKATDALDLRTTMIKVLDDVQFWKGEPMGMIANKLSKLADAHGMSVRGVCKFPDLLEEVGLEENDVDPSDIIEAEAKDRMAWAKIQSRVDALNEKIKEREKKALERLGAPPPKAKSAPKEEPSPTPTKQKVKERTGKKAKIFGFPLTAVVRWMGKEGFNYSQVVTVVEHFEFEVVEVTLKIQLSAGKKGLRGPPADLTLSQERQLHKIAGI